MLRAASEFLYRQSEEQPVTGEMDLAAAQTLPEVLQALEAHQPPAVQFPAAIVCLALCELGVVAGLESGEVVLATFSPASQVILRTDTPHSSEVSSLSNIWEDRLCVTGSSDGELKLWDVEDAQEVGPFPPSQSKVMCIVLTADGSLCVAGGRDALVRVLAVDTREEVASLSGHTGPIACIAATVASTTCVSAGADCALRVWDLSNLRDTATLAGHQGEVTTLALSSDDKLCVTGALDNTVRLWGIQDCGELAVFSGHTHHVTAVAISPDCTHCFSASKDATVRLWSVATHKEVAAYEGHCGEVVALAVSSDGSQCISAGTDQTLRLCSAENLREIATFKGHKAPILSVSLSTDGRYAVSAADSMLRQWTLIARHDSPIVHHSHMVLCVAVTPDGQYCVSGAWDRMVKVWSFSTRRVLGTLVGHTAEVNCLAITVDSRLCVSGSRDKTLRVWDMRKRELVGLLKGHKERVICVAVLPDGKRCVSGSRDSTLKLWSLEEYREVATFSGHSERVLCVAITPDNVYCISGSVDKTLKLWSVSQLCEVSTFKGHSGGVECISITANGRYCVSGSEDRTIKVWDLSARREKATLVGHTGAVGCIATTADSNYCLSGAYEDKTICVWSLSECRQCYSIATGHRAGIWCLAVSPDQQFCVSGAKDGAVRLHALSLATWTAVSSELAPAELISNISHFRDGTVRNIHTASAVFPSHNFNSLHISAYYNHPDRIQDYLRGKVPVIRGAFGSPLTVALQRKAIDSVDVFLTHLIAKVKGAENKDAVWPDFVPFTPDLPAVLQCKSDLIAPFASTLMQTPDSPNLPHFITPVGKLPMTAYMSSRAVAVRDFAESESEEFGTERVRFQISLVRWNLSAGSQESLKLLNALLECSDRDALTSPFAETIIEEKWAEWYWITVGITLLYCLLLLNLTLLIFRSEPEWLYSTSLLFLNSFFLLYESARLLLLEQSYVRWSNAVDITRAVLCTLLGIATLLGSAGKYMVLSTAALSFARGFTHFRSFTMTRAFVYLTLSAFREMYCFLAIFIYATFAFDLCASVLLSNLSWNSAFSLLLGSYNHSSISFVEWTLFSCAAICTLTVFLNLLISTLSEAYQKSLQSLRANDLHQQLMLIIEYETLLYWRRKGGVSTVLVTCRSVDSEKQRSIGTLQQLQSAIGRGNSDLGSRVDRVGKAVGEDILTVKERLAALEEKVDRIGSVEDKVAERLEAVLEFLHSQRNPPQ